MRPQGVAPSLPFHALVPEGFTGWRWQGRRTMLLNTPVPNPGALFACLQAWRLATMAGTGGENQGRADTSTRKAVSVRCRTSRSPRGTWYTTPSVSSMAVSRPPYTQPVSMPIL